MATPSKEPQIVRSKASEDSKFLENSNPNLRSPGLKSSSSPSVKSAKSQKSAPRSPNQPIAAFRKKIRERKFVVAKKKNPNNPVSNVNCQCKDKTNGKCFCVAYENLRTSQEKFFKSKNDGVIEECFNAEGLNGGGEEVADGKVVEIGKESELISGNSEIATGNKDDVDEGDYLKKNEMGDNCQPEEAESPDGVGCSTMKRRRDKLMEEARESVPEPGSGRVMHLVNAFERLLSMPKDSTKTDEKELEETKKGIKWALPGLQERPKAPETEISLSSFCPGNLLLTAESLGLDSRASSSLDSSQGRLLTDMVVFNFLYVLSVFLMRFLVSVFLLLKVFQAEVQLEAAGTGELRSSASSGTLGAGKWKKQQLKATSLQPFKLRTEQRGKMKEEEFFKKLQEMVIEEEKQRIPIAQGLPWTTDEPECVIKPPVKESTRPVDLKLHTDMRAVERAEFDHQVAEKMLLIEEYKMERERQQKLAEEEEIRRLRKELVPKAQPMPYFDRPFIPRRSVKYPTVPKEPKFHIPQHKKIKCCLSWNDFEHIHTA
ncbi:hypothetical protein Ancab_034239 [Ancistrocladus abbreviatus]